MKTLAIRLFVFVLLVTGFVWGSAAVWTANSTRDEVERVLDHRLVEAAHMVAALNVSPGPAALRADVTSYSRHLACQIWSLDGSLIGMSAVAPDKPLSDTGAGFSERQIDGHEWRVYTHIDATRGVRVMVGDRLRVRHKLVADMLFGLLFSALGGLIVLAVAVWFGVYSGLLPLRRLAIAIEQRSPEEISRINLQNVPRELEPVIASMNTLLDRIRDKRRAESDFVANAAHELQTPLAGLRTQAEIALRASVTSMRNEALIKIIRSVDRTSHLIRQLLDLARLQEAKPDYPIERTRVGDLFDLLLSDFLAASESRNITLIARPVASEISLAIRMDVLRLALGNLVDNALQYSRAGGAIVLDCLTSNKEIKITVSDNGPGIPESERERVRHRFERGTDAIGPGTGLGLSIVEAAIAPQSGILELHSSTDGGLSAVLCFPNDTN